MMIRVAARARHIDPVCQHLDVTIMKSEIPVIVDSFMNVIAQDVGDLGWRDTY
jgi:hypothetical protein